MNDGKQRCAWAATDERLARYHDEEWGVPLHDDRRLFEMLNLEGAQAGLSWLTILARRENYRAAFDSFDAEKIARYDTARQGELLANPGIIRNRLKIRAVVENAKAVLAVRREFGSLDNYLWQFVAGEHFVAANRGKAEAAGKRMSKELKKRGFCFVGPTTCFALMQSIGMINDHEPGCFRQPEIEREK